MQKPDILAVTGAAGAQGGGLLRTILEDPAGRFAARALTRDPNTQAARQLASLGAQVVAAGLDRPESLRRAFDAPPRRQGRVRPFLPRCPRAGPVPADLVLSAIAAEDIGRCAYRIFQRRDLIGKTVGIAGEHLSGAEMAERFTRALGREVRYRDVPPEAYRALGFPGAEDLGNMFQFKRGFNREFRAARDPGFARELHPALQNFETWLARNKHRIPLGQTGAAAT